MNRFKSIIVIVVILVLTAVVTYFIFSTEPVAQQESATKKSAMLVEVISGEQGDFRPTIKATGTVQPARDINLSARVAGEIVQMDDEFVPGATVKKGQVLLRLDPADYQNIVELRASDLAIAEAQLELEMGMQEAAENDYKLASEESLTRNKQLLLRVPQLNIAKANVNTAKARLKQARLDLARTTIKAPFDAHVVTRNANLGSQISVGDQLGRLVGTSEYWIMLNVPVSKVNWLEFPSKNKEGMEVRLRNPSWEKEQYRKGKLYQLIGTVTDQLRFAQVIVKVNEMASTNTNEPILVIGTFVEATIPAKELKDVVRVNRDYLRKGNTIWVMKDEKLEIRQLTIAFEDDRHIYVREGLNSDDQVVTTNLSTVVEGAALRMAKNDSESNKGTDG
ncbi:MAG: efflux RND transporter periplasmic adaptor subunit [Cyclobacteriaceae bacterium]